MLSNWCKITNHKWITPALAGITPAFAGNTQRVLEANAVFRAHQSRYGEPHQALVFAGDS
jgi:hypothetical protein